jgi:hypothetical protein
MSNVVTPHFTVEEEQVPPPQARADHAAATKVLLLAIAALSKRMVVAIADLFTLLTVGSVFWLFISIPDPNSMQLIQLGGYCLFVLAANWIVRR